MKKKSTKKTNINKIIKFFIVVALLIAGIFTYFYLFDSRDKNEIVARVGGEEIYKSDVELKLNEIFQNNSRNSAVKAPEIDEIPQEILKIVLREIYTDKKIFAKAKKVGIDRKKEIKEKIAQVKKAIINQGYIDYVIENEVNDQVISETYVNLSNQINGKKEYNFSHIIVKDESLINKIYKNLAKNPKNFAQQSEKYSLDSKSSKKGGNIGFVIESALAPEISEELPNLKKDQISKPIKTNFGWHIFKYIDVRDAKPLAFEAVRNNIENQLIQEKISNLKNNLFNDAEIEILVKTKDQKQFESEVANDENQELEVNVNDSVENEESNQENQEEF